jgi:8-oxo-dGTP diphosphatase
MKLGTLCYIRKNNTTLLLHRDKKEHDEMHGYWIGLGGKVDIDHGETPDECIVREVHEESGLTVKPKLRGIITFRNVASEMSDWYAYIFTADEYTGKLVDSHEGTLGWIKDNELKKLSIPEGDMVFIHWLQKDTGLFSAKFVYKNRKLQDYSVIFY